MPGLLSRFKAKRNGSSSSVTDESHHERSSSIASDDNDDTATLASSSTANSPAGSRFVEDLASVDGYPTKRQSQQAQPSEIPTSVTKTRPPPLEVPGSAGLGPVLGTPKLTLTEEGSNSPRSFESSPIREQGLGLGPGLGGSPLSKRRNFAVDDDLETPTTERPYSLHETMPTSANAPVVAASTPASVHLDAQPIGRSGSISSTTGRPRSDSNKKSQKSPSMKSVSLLPTKDKKKKKKRTLSTSSGVSGSIVALAKSVTHIGSPSGDDQSTSSRRKSGSKFLSKPSDGLDGDEDEDDDDDTIDDDDDDSDSEYEEHLPVTGFAVASNKRNGDFHAMFSAVDENDYLIEDYGCAMAREILVQGRLYVSENHICFHANIFGWVTDVVIPFNEIKSIEKKMTALVIPNAIGIYTQKEKYTFASLISRDTTYDVMMNVWRLCNPNAVMSTTSFGNVNGGSRPPSPIGDLDAPATSGSGGASHGGKGHARTQCACGKSGQHFTETALDTVFPSSPEKVYELMFNSDWYKHFLTESQKLRELDQGEWSPSSSNPALKSRPTSYIKPLNGSIGPKQTKCIITDEQEHCNFDDYVSMLTTTRTPDVPSGGVFSVKTRTCLTWAGAGSTKVIVTTQVEWTGKSWVKGIIEKSAIEGQKQYHDDLEKGVRQHMKDHASDYHIEGAETEETTATSGVGEAKTPTEAEQYAAENKAKSPPPPDWTDNFGLAGPVIKSALDIAGDIPINSTTILSGLIIVLLVSNLYTYFAYSPKESSSVRRAKRLGASVEDEVRAILVREGIAKSTPGEGKTEQEVGELERILDHVEKRVGVLRSSLSQVTES